MIELIVYGKVQPKQRPRVNTYTRRAYTPNETINYSNYIKSCYLEKYKKPLLYEGALKAKIKAIYPIPKSTNKNKRMQMIEGIIRPTIKPDVDNVIKTAFDSINGLAYHDDKQIVSSNIEKYYGEVPRLEIEIDYI